MRLRSAIDGSPSFLAPVSWRRIFLTTFASSPTSPQSAFDQSARLHGSLSAGCHFSQRVTFTSLSRPKLRSYGKSMNFPIMSSKSWLDDLPRPIHNHGTRERSRVLRVGELQPSANESDLRSSLHDEALKPFCIYPRRNEADHGRAVVCLLKSLRHPLRNVAAIGRIHPASTRSPPL